MDPKNSLAICKANRAKICIWLCKWGWTTEKILQQLLQVKRRPGADLVKQGVLKKVNGDVPGRIAYFLSDESQAVAQREYPHDIYLTYPFGGRRTISWDHFLHHECSQKIALAEQKLRHGEIFSAREILAAGSRSSSSAIPDFSLQRITDDLIEWHEVERNPKYHEKLIHQLWTREVARRKGKFSEIYWHCLTEKIACNLKSMLSKPSLPATIRRGDGRVVVDNNLSRWNTRDLLKVSHFLVMDDDRQNPREIFLKKYYVEEEEVELPPGLIAVIDGL